MQEKKPLEEMTVEELKKELAFVNECLDDEIELHSFTLNKTSAHMRAAKAQAKQDEHEEKCDEYRQRIRQIGQLIKARTA